MLLRRLGGAILKCCENRPGETVAGHRFYLTVALAQAGTTVSPSNRLPGWTYYLVAVAGGVPIAWNSAAVSVIRAARA
jgi:hypothetical protein